MRSRIEATRSQFFQRGIPQTAADLFEYGRGVTERTRRPWVFVENHAVKRTAPLAAPDRFHVRHAQTGDVGDDRVEFSETGDVRLGAPAECRDHGRNGDAATAGTAGGCGTERTDAGCAIAILTAISTSRSFVRLKLMTSRTYSRAPDVTGAATP